MVNLHDLYLGTIEAVLNSNKLDAVHQPEGEKPAGVIWAMRVGTTKPDLFITYLFAPTRVTFKVFGRDDGRGFEQHVSYVEGVEAFLAELVKFINAGKLAAPKA
jgi:hypothetical protein